MITSRTCSWCSTMTSDWLCPECGHRADRARMDCDCGVCRRTESPKDADGFSLAVDDLVEFVEPYDGFTGGVVVELLRGVTGPMAGVRIAPGRTADTLCRRMRKAVSQ